MAEQPSSSPSATRFLTGVLEQVKEEWKVQREEYGRRLQRTLENRVKDGFCVSGVRWERAGQNGQEIFSTAENFSDFREGDLVILHEGDPQAPLARMVWMGDESVEHGREDIILGSTNGRTRREWPTGELIIDQGFMDLEDRYVQTLQNVASSFRGQERILPLLMATAGEDMVSQEEFTKSVREAEEAGFNASQQEAIAEGVSAQWCALIQGPPGTGKTRVLAEIVRQRVARGERILLTGFTHRAIHHALNVVHGVLPDTCPVVKIGQPLGDGKLSVDEYANFKDSPLTGCEGGYVVGATPFAARSKRLAGVDFDCVVMDEASQMPLAQALMAMLSADIYIIIGDPKQLPPVLQSVPPGETVRYSIFAALEKNRDKALLTETYRMNQALTEWVSNEFYLGLLQAAEKCRDRHLELSPERTSPEWMEELLKPEVSLGWVEIPHSSARTASFEEAAMVRELILSLTQRGVDPAKIGVVTPFRRQARLIRQRLRSGGGAQAGFFREIIIDTVERMQGQEREVVILSTAVSDPDFISAREEFIYLPARLNVAVSRARTKLLVFSSKVFLENTSSRDSIQEALAHWQSLRSSARTVLADG